jgi:arsenate reductase
MNKPIILGLCTANRCRSQMFEAIMNHYAAGHFEVISAGTTATFVHPLAIKVLSEIGISTEGQTSKKIAALDPASDTLILLDQNQQQLEYPLSRVAHVITLCGGANETCPLFPSNIQRDHWPIDDPDHYSGSEEEVLPYFRDSRDDILHRAQRFIKTTKDAPHVLQ